MENTMVKYLLQVLNVEGLDLNKVKDTISKYCIQFIVSPVEKSGTEKDHIHGCLLFKSSQEYKSFRRCITEKYNKKGQDFKMVLWNPDKGDGLSYILKEANENNEGFYSLGWEQDYKDNRDKYVEKEKFIKQKITKKEQNFTKQMIKDFEKFVKEGQWEKCVRDLQKEDIIRWVVRYLVDNSKIQDKFIINRFFNLLYGKYCDWCSESKNRKHDGGRYIEEMVNQVLQLN